MHHKKSLGLAMCVLILAASSNVYAEKLPFQDTDTLNTLLLALQGKQAEIHLASGENLAGIVKQVGTHTLLLARLKGRDFFDAYINIDDITVLIVSNQ